MTREKEKLKSRIRLSLDGVIMEYDIEVIGPQQRCQKHDVAASELFYHFNIKYVESLKKQWTTTVFCYYFVYLRRCEWVCSRNRKLI